MEKKFLYFLSSFFIFFICFQQFIFANENSAAVLVYHRFGEKTYPTTNITLSQFKSHIKEIKENNYNVLTIHEIVDHIINKKQLPEKTISLTIDDAFKSIYKKAWPLLKASGLPFTIFVSTGPIDSNLRSYMSWKNIKELYDAGITIGHHTEDHPHLVNKSIQFLNNQIENANISFKKNLDYVPDIFSYPFGEYSLEIKEFIKEKKFIAAFGQQSGIIFNEIDMFELPRFSMNEKYGSLKRFKFAINAKALAVKEITPRNIVIEDINPPLMGFTLINDVNNEISCYPSHNLKANITRLSDKRIEIRFNDSFPKGRTRVNCTTNDNNTWRWFGIQFYRP
tara:strand:- start:1146 stop:2159 length:1014 start_codon:yes stop_codon:yes gene_type:complete